MSRRYILRLSSLQREQRGGLLIKAFNKRLPKRESAVA